jgi:hypothetical protein
MSHNAMGGIKVRLRHTAMPALTYDGEFFPEVPKHWGLIEHCVPPKVAALHERFTGARGATASTGNDRAGSGCGRC